MSEPLTWAQVVSLRDGWTPDGRTVLWEQRRALIATVEAIREAVLPREHHMQEGKGRYEPGWNYWVRRCTVCRRLVEFIEGIEPMHWPIGAREPIPYRTQPYEHAADCPVRELL